MKAIVFIVGGIVLELPLLAGAQVVPGDAAVRAQWFTGSLEAPSPAFPKAGIFAVEPYFIYTHNTGGYDDNRTRQSVADAGAQSAAVILLKYALTDRISIQAIPLVAHSWNDESSSNGVGDLPVEIEYRFNDENDRTGFPSVTASLGVNLPIGHYDRLRSPLDGLGNGAYTVKEGLLAQSLFDTWGHHPVRIRLYGAAYETLSDVSVIGQSVYGTSDGFSGRATRRFSSQLGVGAGYALDQQWVLAFDLVQRFGNGFHLQGTNIGPASVNVSTSGNSSTSVATAVEYNFSGSIGVIAGVEFSVAGRNASSYVAPQIAISMSF
jgi:hypothetical protein